MSFWFSEPLCVSFASFHTHELHFWKKSSRLFALKGLRALVEPLNPWKLWQVNVTSCVTADEPGVQESHSTEWEISPLQSMRLWVKETLKTMSHPPQRGRRHVWKSEGTRRRADSGRWRNNGCLISCRDALIRPNWILITSYSLAHCLSFCVLQYPSSNQPSSAIFSEISFTHSY